jgi:hypothetical protein
VKEVDSRILSSPLIVALKDGLGRPVSLCSQHAIRRRDGVAAAFISQAKVEGNSV